MNRATGFIVSKFALCLLSPMWVLRSNAGRISFNFGCGGLRGAWIDWSGSTGRGAVAEVGAGAEVGARAGVMKSWFPSWFCQYAAATLAPAALAVVAPTAAHSAPTSLRSRRTKGFKEGFGYSLILIFLFEVWWFSGFLRLNVPLLATTHDVSSSPT